MVGHKQGPPWHLPADIPAVGVKLLGRALHPQPQLEAEDGPGAPHPGGARGPKSRRLLSPVLVSVCPVRPVLSLLWCSLFLPPALGFFLRKRGRRRPDTDVRGAAERGEAGNALARAIFGPYYHLSSRNGCPGAQRSHAGACACLNISPAVIPLALRHLPSPSKLFYPTYPQHTTLPPPAPTPVCCPVALPTPGRG